ncbi:hypothetical conserved protein [Candidatus Nitrosoglobus terrae]|uniref:Hypothetical conserved protein n=1 Tax=Candidatus Nitrosoglobus terrae TaxID=1630141 RepID=A0A1Q2SM96_9GAMM|nr:hypothetical protein [Candidatus Nitrosoglobus terrae]BAW80256.1 hypothetical conserved protein [Candidatus Nitrosoglobus terrae]
MEAVNTWEAILLGLLVLFVILWSRPGIKAAFQHAEKIEQKDWRGFLLPIILVILFVVFLVVISMTLNNNPDYSQGLSL